MGSSVCGIRSRIWLASALLSCGCGASGVGLGADPASCEETRAEAERAWTQLAEAAATPATEEGQPSPVDATINQLRAHARGLRANPPEEVDGEVALALSGAVMDTFDSLDGVTPELRREADDAAEALLTDRSAGGSMQAARAAVRALETALGISDPTASRALDQSRIERTAQSVAEGYAEDARAGDRRARRADETALELNGEVQRARTTALEASQQTREICRLPNVLLVPSL